MKRIIGSLFAVLAIAMFVMACGDDNKDSCGDGEVKLAIVTNGVAGDAQCFKTCTDTVAASDCPNPAAQECKGSPSVCRDKAVVDTNNDNNDNNDNNTPEEPTISAEHTTLCEDYCEISVGCIYEWCGSENIQSGLIQSCLHGSAGDPEDIGCIGELTGTSEDAAAIEAAADEYRSTVYANDGSKITCDDTKYLSCAYANIFKAQGASFNCGCTESTTVGNACEKAEDCDSGALPSGCIPETTAQGEDTGYPGGYCVAQACDLEVPLAERIIGSANPNSSGCGAGNYCVMERYENSSMGTCYPGCEQTEDCRPGYACQARASVVELGTDGSVTKETMAKSCLPASCETDADCGTGENQGRCNVATKACEFRCTDDSAKAFCESGGGECTGEEGKTFCVLS